MANTKASTIYDTLISKYKTNEGITAAAKKLYGTASDKYKKVLGLIPTATTATPKKEKMTTETIYQGLLSKYKTNEGITNAAKDIYGEGTEKYNKTLSLFPSTTSANKVVTPKKTTIATPTKTVTTPKAEVTKKEEIKITPTKDTTKDTTKDITPDLLNKTKDEITQKKTETLGTQKTADIGDVWNNFSKSSEILTGNNANLLNLYGVDEAGNIDLNNKESIAYKTEQSRKEYEDLKESQFDKFKSGRYQQVIGQIRQTLASRGVDVSKVPQEQLIALSNSVGKEAFVDVYNAKETMIEGIKVNNDNAEAKLTALREKGLISSNELNKSIEALRQTAEGQISTINKEYANTMFSLAETKIAETEAIKTDTLNTITTLGSQLGLSGTGLGVLNGYIGKYNDPQKAYEAIIKDLGNTGSALYKSINDIEVASAAQQAFENQLALTEAEGSTSSSATKFSAVQQTTLSALTGYDVKSVDDLKTVIPYLTDDQKDSVDKYIGGTFAGSILSDVEKKTNVDATSGITVDAGTTQNRPDRNNNPGNVKIGDVGYGVDNQNHTIFGDALTGYKAMVSDITAKLTGGSARKSKLTGQILSPESTLADLGSVYAEDPKWTSNVVSIANKSFGGNYGLNTKLKDIDVNKITPAIARQEGFTGKITT